MFHEAGFFFISSLQVSTEKMMIQILFYLIPFQGIFLSLFFLVRSERSAGPNFLMGFMLLSFSFPSLIQLIHFLTEASSQQPASQRILNELMVSPFLFLYTMALLRPAVQRYKGFHLLFIGLNLLMLLTISWFSIPINKIILNAFSLINSMYLLGSLILLRISASGFTWIVMLNLLVTGALSLSMLCHAVSPVRLTCPVLLSKGLVICYVYYKILDKVATNGHCHCSPS